MVVCGCGGGVCLGRVFFLFFKQKTAYEMRISDWSSDVCSSDLFVLGTGPANRRRAGLSRSAMSRAAMRGVQGDDYGKGAPHRPGGRPEIGRASCRESVCQYV